MTMIGNNNNNKMTVVKGPRAVLHQNENNCLVQKAFKKTTSTPSKPTRTGRWTQEEKLLFLYGLNKFGRGKWKKIGTLLPTRSLIQIKSHAQKVMKRFEAGENVFAALDENRDYFDYLVLPSAQKKVSSSMPGLVDEYSKPKSSPKARKQVLGSSSSMNKRPKSSPSRSSPTSLARRSVFQATLGNGNLSFSFASRKPCHRVSFKEQQPQSPSQSPSSSVLNDSRGGGAAIAAAALCQLSTLGRGGDQAVVVSP